VSHCLLRLRLVTKIREEGILLSMVEAVFDQTRTKALPIETILELPSMRND
jgi:hypothetical protein